MSVVWLHKSWRWTKRKEALILYWRSDGINHTGITMITPHASNTEVVCWHSLALTCCLMVVLLGHFWAFGLAWPREIPSQKWCGKRSKWWSKSQVTGCPSINHDNHARFVVLSWYFGLFWGSLTLEEVHVKRPDHCRGHLSAALWRKSITAYLSVLLQLSRSLWAFFNPVGLFPLFAYSSHVPYVTKEDDYMIRFVYFNLY